MSQAGSLGGGGGGGAGSVTKLTGNSGGAVSPSVLGNINIVGAGGVTVIGTPLTNTLTITHSAVDITWTPINASQTMAVNTGYIVTANAVSLALPPLSVVGDLISIILDGGTSWTVTQGLLQQIRYGIYETSVGVGGSLGSNYQGDCITMVCVVASTRWVVYNGQGNMTVI